MLWARAEFPITSMSLTIAGGKAWRENSRALARTDSRESLWRFHEGKKAGGLMELSPVTPPEGTEGRPGVLESLTGESFGTFATGTLGTDGAKTDETTGCSHSLLIPSDC